MPSLSVVNHVSGYDNAKNPNRNRLRNPSRSISKIFPDWISAWEKTHEDIAQKCVRGYAVGVLIASTFLITAVGNSSTMSRKDQGSRLDCYRECCVEKLCFGCDARLCSSVADGFATSRYRRKCVSRMIGREGECIRIHFAFGDELCLRRRGNQEGSVLIYHAAGAGTVGRACFRPCLSVRGRSEV